MFDYENPTEFKQRYELAFLKQKISLSQRKLKCIFFNY